MSLYKEVSLASDPNRTEHTSVISLRVGRVGVIVRPAPIVADVALDGGNGNALCGVRMLDAPVEEVSLTEDSRTRSAFDAWDSPDDASVLV